MVMSSVIMSSWTYLHNDMYMYHGQRKHVFLVFDGQSIRRDLSRDTIDVYPAQSSKYCSNYQSNKYINKQVLINLIIFKLKMLTRIEENVSTCEQH